MTLNELFTWLYQHPGYPLGYLLGIPFLAGLLGLIVDDRSGRDPWRYVYMFLMYLSCVPGIFAIILMIYGFFFGKMDLYEIDLISHVLPVISMIATIYIIRRFVSLDLIPGFGKLTGLILMITTALILLWVLDKTRIILFSYLPFSYVLGILIALLLIFRYGLKKVF